MTHPAYPDARTIEQYQKMVRRSFPVTTPVADVTDALAFPEIARAIDHARKLREAGK